MLKKVGMVAVAATVGLLALSPIAFAGGGETTDGSSQINSVDGERNQVGSTNTNDNNTNNPVQECGNLGENSATSTITENPVTGTYGSGLLTNEGGDATSAVECEQGGNAGDELMQVNES